MAEEAAVNASETPEQPEGSDVQDEKKPTLEEKNVGESQSLSETKTYSGTKHKVKDGDNELEVDYDELVKGYQMRSASERKFREAAEVRKQVDSILDATKKGDHNALVKLLGKDAAKKVSEQLLLEEIEFEQLPEHEKTIKQLEREKREAEKKLEEQETKRQTIERQQLEQQFAVQLEKEIMGALKESNMKGSPRLVSRMAEEMEAHIVATGDPLPAKEALKRVTGGIPKDFTEYVKSLSKEQLKDLKKALPKEFLDMLRKDDVAAVLSQSPIGQRQTKTDDLPPKRSKADANRMSTDKWFQQMEKRFSNN